jgi:dolichyl-phosphate-mannose--protein O-mannosyl transferase
MIDSKQAIEALNDIEQIVRRVRQSRIYNLASLIMIMWGALVFVGYVATYLSPRNGGIVWIVIYVMGIAGSFVISKVDHAREGVRTLDLRMLAAFALFVAFGIFCSWLGHFTPRQLGTFWPIYFMLAYTIAGLWAGYAFVAIGLGITALTLIGYFFAGSWFDLWMAFVDGGGLMLGGLWMRRS